VVLSWAVIIKKSDFPLPHLMKRQGIGEGRWDDLMDEHG